MENKLIFIYFLTSKKLTYEIRYLRYLVINIRSHK